MIYIAPLKGTYPAKQMQSELTKYPNSTLEPDDQRIIGGVLARDSNSDRIANKSKERIFVMCDVCFWATTYLDKSRLPVHDSRCSRCQEVGLSSFPVLADESFTYAYSERRGVELSFVSRR
ncbi:MAG TPA: hypothetical protein VE130_02495 [Nitrososphaeraceae archaeon]|nr:hypothetical protein [Nitrososphaeraceae archaeon]